MGDVWLAYDARLGRLVAVKQLRRALELDAHGVDRLIREARLAATLQHARVVAVYDLLIVDEQPIVVMEYVEGESLATLLRRTKGVDVATALVLGRDVGLALAAAHEAGIVHRDVKPANILIAANGRAKLADFGIARGSDDSALTGTGQMVGTVAFMAPETALGSPPTPAADIYSLGATLYSAVEGHAPFTSEDGRQNTATMLLRMIREDAPTPRRAGPLSPLLSRMLSREVTNRPTAAEVLTILTDLIRAPDELASSPAASGPSAAPGPRSMDSAAAAVVGVARAPIHQPGADDAVSANDAGGADNADNADDAADMALAPTIKRTLLSDSSQPIDVDDRPAQSPPGPAANQESPTVSGSSRKPDHRKRVAAVVIAGAAVLTAMGTLAATTRPVSAPGVVAAPTSTGKGIDMVGQGPIERLIVKPTPESLHVSVELSRVLDANSELWVDIQFARTAGNCPDRIIVFSPKQRQATLGTATCQGEVVTYSVATTLSSTLEPGSVNSAALSWAALDGPRGGILIARVRLVTEGQTVSWLPTNQSYATASTGGGVAIPK